MKETIKNLLKVKSIITITLTIAFVVRANHRGCIYAYYNSAGVCNGL